MEKTTQPTACMGGFCHQREGCARHHLNAGPVEQISERVCAPGKEQPVRFLSPSVAEVNPPW